MHANFGWWPRREVMLGKWQSAWKGGMIRLGARGFWDSCSAWIGWFFWWGWLSVRASPRLEVVHVKGRGHLLGNGNA